MNKKIILLSSVIMFNIIACSKTNFSSTSLSLYSSNEEQNSSEILNIEEFTYFPNQVIEVGQKEYIFQYVSGLNDVTISSENNEIAAYNAQNKTLEGNKIGNTKLILKKGNKCQMVDVEVLAKGSLSRAWTFEEIKQKEIRKNFIVIGDSVSADETYFNKDNTYAKLVADLVGGQLIKNYAIGGTTATYMYKNSNIEKEYGDNQVAIDGVRVTKKAFDNNELNDIDFAFIAYGHNDQYFQPPIDSEGIFNIENFDSAHSFKGSYRYMINLLRTANPNIKIILLNCTYSEYAARSTQWDYKLTYNDYRKAIDELAIEMDCKLIDPWKYMEKYFDGKTNKAYYHDDVHLSKLGHQKLRDYIMKH